MVRAAVWNDQGSLDVVDRPVPDPKPGWVRVAVSAVGICGTDLHFFSGAFPSPAGLLPGHEIGGTVDIVGDGGPEPGLTAGQAVAVEPLVTCGRCPHCRSGNYTRCATRMLLGVTGRGGMAELMTAPATSIYPLPDGVTAADGALVEPLAVCVRGVRRAGVGLGDRVLVLGSGTIGLLSALAARTAGAAEVAVTARHPHQQAAAATFGADAVFGSADAAADGLGDSWADVVLETVGGRASTVAEAVRLARPGGSIGMLGIFDRDTRLPGLDFSTKELRLVGSNCYARAGARSDFDVAVSLLDRHVDLVRSIVTHRFELDEVNDAFRTAADKTSQPIKVSIQPSGG
jgi:threonine dehydrogenase-like Zn-dependent dehydrogenase